MVQGECGLIIRNDKPCISIGEDYQLKTERFVKNDGAINIAYRYYNLV